MHRTLFIRLIPVVLFPLCLCLYFPAAGQSSHHPFSGTTSLSWEECIAKFKALDEFSDLAKLSVCGSTDIGKPLHLFIVNKDKQFYPELFDRHKTVILINNAIHPGEPDGVDACAILCEELLHDPGQWQSLLDSIIICIIPMYNVDGALNRGSFSRANQDGPDEYGFRGNARNLDLNRDFIKCDSENARSFARLFHRIDPDVFVDTHVSDGADYPYTMTLISTQSDKLGPIAGSYLRDHFTPALFEAMSSRGDAMCPYVNTMGATPETGLSGFLETPRFASGYAALFGTFGFITETHMLKPFAKRVESTYQFLLSMLLYCHGHSNEIRNVRQKARSAMQGQKLFTLAWELDTLQKTQLPFTGYSPVTSPALVGSGERMYYDHQGPWSKSIPYYSRYKSSRLVTCPSYYVIPQAWREVIDRLKWNGVLMKRFDRDTTFTVSVKYILDLHSPAKPYEGHFNHSAVTTRSEDQRVAFYAGDYMIPMDQPARRYLVEVLEPEGEDSFFAWNFFDSILQQKEWFSDYVFEEKAAELLATDPDLKKRFTEAMNSDESIEKDHWQQLLWIYKNSPYYEKTAFRYPVYSIK